MLRHRSRRRRPLRVRLRRAPLAWWTAAVGLAVATGFTVDGSLARAESQARRFGSLVTVPVVARPVSAGQTVRDGDVRLEPRPSALLPSGEPAERPAGRAALVPLVPGEVLLESKLAAGGRRGVTALLPPGARALTVPGGPAGIPPVRVGDAVDVLATFPDHEEPTIVVAEAALVVAVDRELDAVTVAVRAEEAPPLAFALATATVTLALASR